MTKIAPTPGMTPQRDDPVSIKLNFMHALGIQPDSSIQGARPLVLQSRPGEAGRPTASGRDLW
ncbi:MAG: hypothetical protein R2849_12930 [Thermomicrobiales bacterium]